MTSLNPWRDDTTAIYSIYYTHDILGGVTHQHDDYYRDRRDAEATAYKVALRELKSKSNERPEDGPEIIEDGDHTFDIRIGRYARVWVEEETLHE